MENILPFIFILTAIISKFRKKTPRDIKIERVRDTDISNNKQITGYDADNVLNDNSDIVNLDIVTMSHRDNKDMLEGYNKSQMKTFEKTVNTSGVTAHKSSGDFIRRKEIGKTNEFLNEHNVLNGIIMAEILGKPKSFKK